ncbi:MAG TPA: hypothetical protein VK186_13550, partial [Candidatus Deferrimicrobium sp.]|nr:hypothetical protein [Candidatus Deferrimicrobium sp.]
SFIILDMQQWYKRDVTQRFYLYHALNTGMQLEKIPSKRVLYDYSYQKKKKTKDYRALQPVITLVWLADDALGFDDDYVAYSMTPEMVVEFIKNEKLWHKPVIVELLKKRARLLKILNNQTKDLDFLAKNRLIFMVQKNTVKNKNKAKYVKWFEFAEKTKNLDNKKEDFKEYLDDEIFCEMMERLSREELTDDDFIYIQEEKTIREEVERFEQQIYKDGWKDGKKANIREEMERFEKEIYKDVWEKAKKANILEIAKRLKEKGLNNDFITDICGLSPKELTQL